jgi:hypothetical protein
VLGLAAALSLWYLSAEDANPCYLASVAAAVLVDQLLQVRPQHAALSFRSSAPCYLAAACLSQSCSRTPLHPKALRRRHIQLHHSLFHCNPPPCLLQHDYTFDKVSAKSAAGAKLCRLLRLRPLTNLLTSTAVDSSRGLLLITLVRAGQLCVFVFRRCCYSSISACLAWCIAVTDPTAAVCFKQLLYCGVKAVLTPRPCCCSSCMTHTGASHQQPARQQGSSSREAKAQPAAARGTGTPGWPCGRHCCCTWGPCGSSQAAACAAAGAGERHLHLP